MQIENFTKKVLLCATILIMNPAIPRAVQPKTEIKAVLWDFVLVTEQATGSIWSKELFSYSFSAMGRAKELQEKFFDVFAKASADSEALPYKVTEPKYHLLMPVKMCQWLTGQATGPELIKLGHNFSKQVIKDKTTREMIDIIIDFTYNPKKLAFYTQPEGHAVKLMKEIHKKDPSLKQLLIGNFDKDTFEESRKQEHMEKLWEHINGSRKKYISGYTGLLLPNPAALQKVLTDEGLVAEEVLFISGQQLSIDAAKKLGMKTIYAKDNNAKHAKDKLKEFNLGK